MIGRSGQIITRGYGARGTVGIVTRGYGPMGTILGAVVRWVIRFFTRFPITVRLGW